MSDKLSPYHWSLGSQLVPSSADPRQWTAHSDGRDRTQDADGERWTLHGRVLDPTLISHDVHALVEYRKDGTAEIIEISMKPSLYIRDKDGTLRERTPDEYGLAVITASSIKVLDLGGMRHAISRWWRVLSARPSGGLEDKAAEHAHDSTLTDPRSAQWAEWATAILNEQLEGGRGYLTRLALKEGRAKPDGRPRQEDVEMWKKRASRLRKKSWLTEAPGKPGDLLIHWWRRNPGQIPDWWKESNGKSP